MHTHVLDRLLGMQYEAGRILASLDRRLATADLQDPARGTAGVGDEAIITEWASMLRWDIEGAKMWLRSQQQQQQVDQQQVDEDGVEGDRDEEEEIEKRRSDRHRNRQRHADEVLRVKGYIAQRRLMLKLLGVSMPRGVKRLRALGSLHDDPPPLGRQHEEHDHNHHHHREHPQKRQQQQQQQQQRQNGGAPAASQWVQSVAALGRTVSEHHSHQNSAWSVDGETLFAVLAEAEILALVAEA